MRTLLTVLLVSFLIGITSCAEQERDRYVQLIVSNPNNYDMKGTVTGLTLQSVLDSLLTKNIDNIVLTDEQGNPVSTQLFNNGETQLFLFECSVLANGESAYTFQRSSDTPEHGVILPIAARIEKMDSALTESDSLRAVFPIDLLGGTAYPYPAGIPRNPWHYKTLETLASGSLMCAFRLSSDTLYIAGDTLIEHRTLVKQKGSNLTIVREQFKNAGNADTLLLLNQLAAGLPYTPSDSIVINNEDSYFAIQRGDTAAIGIFAPQKATFINIPGNRLAAFLLPCCTDSILTYYVATGNEADAPYSLEDAVKELQHMHDAPLSVRIAVRI